jgi:hypothetical protein
LYSLFLFVLSFFSIFNVCWLAWRNPHFKKFKHRPIILLWHLPFLPIKGLHNHHLNTLVCLQKSPSQMLKKWRNSIQMLEIEIVPHYHMSHSLVPLPCWHLTPYLLLYTINNFSTLLAFQVQFLIVLLHIKTSPLIDT